jgi:hypothetical protein
MSLAEYFIHLLMAISAKEIPVGLFLSRPLSDIIQDDGRSPRRDGEKI